MNPSPVTGAPTPYMNFPYSGTTPVGNNQGPPVVDASGRRIYVPPNPNVPSATMPTMQDGGTLASLNGGQTNTQAQVRMQAPDGSVGFVPADKVTQATAAGGVVLS